MSLVKFCTVIFITARHIAAKSAVVLCDTDEHNTAEYEKVNPFRLLPAIDDNGFKLTERLKFFHYCFSLSVAECIFCKK